jgi:hypothetical protein
MQIIKQCSRNLSRFQLSLLIVCAIFLATAFGPLFVYANKAKPDQPRPQTKTPAKSLANRPSPRTVEWERKGKKGLALPPASVQLGKKIGKAEPIAATRTARGEQNSRLKLATRSERAAEKPTLAKASTKLTNKTLPAKTLPIKTALTSKAPRLVEQPLTSRLTRATFTPAPVLKLQEESGRRGKYGKRESDEVFANEHSAGREDDREVEGKEEKEAATILPIRRNETTKSRNVERNPERVEAMPATRPREINTAADTPAYQIQLPDKIEVVEYGSTSPTISKLLTLPESRPLTPFGAIVTKTNTPPTKRNDLAIPQQRVFEIQYELVKRGFYSAEPNGLYDEATVLAMWEFQKNYGLPATGYPSAHTLKRLGLTSW